MASMDKRYQLPRNADGEIDEAKLKAIIELSEQADRFDDMCYFLKELVKIKKGQFEDTERQWLSVAFKNVVGTLRSAWREIQNPLKEFKESPDKPLDAEAAKRKKQCSEYHQLIANEIITKCSEVVDLLSTGPPNGIFLDDGNHEKKVFYLKMKGDYYRYMAEVNPDEAVPDKAGKTESADGKKRTYGFLAQEAYAAAHAVAEQHLTQTDPTRLGLALNRSVCYYEILKEPKMACDVAKQAFDDAIQKLDTLTDSSYKDSTLIMQLLRDNLTLWTSETETASEQQIED